MLPVTDLTFRSLAASQSLYTTPQQISHTTMQALQTAEWYKEHPKPFIRNGRNLDQNICCTGLRLSVTEFREMCQSILTAIQEDNILLNEPSGLRGVETKDRVKAILKTVASNVGHKYGWSEIDEIDENIIPDYMFEMAKRSANNKKRKARAMATTRSDCEMAKRSPNNKKRKAGAVETAASDCETPLPQPQHKGSPQQGLLSPITLRHGVETPASSGASTPSRNISVGQGLSLRTCDIFVTQDDTGLEYEDTIDTFLKADSKRLDIEFGPNDFDFTIFRQQLTQALSYNQESDMIYYTHEQKGEVEVSYDWKWRVALKYLSSQPGAQGILKFGIKRRDEHPSFGDRNAAELSVNPAIPPSTPQTTGQLEISPPQIASSLPAHTAVGESLNLTSRRPSDQPQPLCGQPESCPDESPKPLQSSLGPAIQQRSDLSRHTSSEFESPAQSAATQSQPDQPDQPAKTQTLLPSSHEQQSNNHANLSQLRDRYPCLAFATPQPADAYARSRTASGGDPQLSQKRVLAAPSSDRNPERQKRDTRSELSYSDDEEGLDSDPIVDRRRHRAFLEQTNDDPDSEDFGYSSEVSDGLEVDYDEGVEDESQDDSDRQEIQELTDDERIAM
jgi:hypothetical protein